MSRSSQEAIEHRAFDEVYIATNTWNARIVGVIRKSLLKSFSVIAKLPTHDDQEFADRETESCNNEASTDWNEAPT